MTMKQYSDKEISDKAQALFKQYQSEKLFYATPDGQFFREADKSLAYDHARQTGQKVQVVKKATAPKAAKKAAPKGDDLTKIKGIGPKTAEVLGGFEINTIADLAAADSDLLAALADETELSAEELESYRKQALEITKKD